MSATLLPPVARVAVDDLLVRLDRALPGRVEGFYVVGSACLGSFRLGRSDIDFVAIVAGELGRRELTRLRAIHLGRWAAALARDVGLHGRWPLVCNGSYLPPASLAASPRAVTPLAGHVAGRFRVASATASTSTRSPGTPWPATGSRCVAPAPTGSTFALTPASCRPGRSRT
ncbi:MAG: hypothetical protein JO286_09915 [Solirubrobacterales bacterium]|nr:hypothetical protein [Solirubrobacterales bacterium]